MDAKLSWEQHIDYLATKLSALCYTLNILASNIGRDAVLVMQMLTPYYKMG